MNEYEVASMQKELGELQSVRYWLWRGIALFLILLGGLSWGCPKYRVWQQGLEGQAELARAEQNRQIAIQVSKAKFDASQYEAQAETTRAHGVARANQIIGSSLGGESGQAYLRYLWIHTLNDSTKQVIYVPTETGLPLLEAGKRHP